MMQKQEQSQVLISLAPVSMVPFKEKMLGTKGVLSKAHPHCFNGSLLLEPMGTNGEPLGTVEVFMVSKTIASGRVEA